MPATATQELPVDEQRKLEQGIEQEETEAGYQREQGREDQAAAHAEEAEKLREKLAGLTAEAGAPTGSGDPAAEAEAAQERDRAGEPEPEKVIVRGIEIPYLNAGGKRPTAGSLKFTGGKVELEHGTAFKKGMAIEFSGTAIIKKIAVVDTHDPSTGQVTNAEQAHEARIVDLIVEIPSE